MLTRQETRLMLRATGRAFTFWQATGIGGRRETAGFRESVHWILITISTSKDVLSQGESTKEEG